MPAFSALSRSGPIALFALSLSVFVPAAGFAQETLPVAEDVEPSVAPVDAPTDVPTNDTIADAVPADAPVTEAQLPDAELADGRLSIAGADDIQVSITTDDDTSIVWATLAHPEFPDLPHTAVMVAHPGPDLDAISAAVMDQFNEIDSVVEGEFQGAPVWVISGAASRRPDGDRPARTSPRAQIMVTQTCVVDGGPVVFGVVTTQMRAAPVVLSVILSDLTLSMPDDAAACTDEIGAAVMALPIGEIDRPEPVADLGPLVEHERFGLRLVTPDGMRVRRDRDNAGGQEYWLTSAPEGSSVGSDVTLRVFSIAQRAEISTFDVRTPEFAERLGQLASVPVSLTDEVTQLGATTLLHFVGSAMQENDGVTAERRVLFLINPTPSPAGLSPWLAITSFGISEAEAVAFEQQIIEGLALADPTRFDGYRIQDLLGGTVRVAMLPGQSMANLDENDDSAILSIAQQSAASDPHTLYALEGRENAGLDLIEALPRRLSQIDSVSEGIVDGVPVWLFDGSIDRLPSRRNAPDGVVSPARLVVTRICGPNDGGPLVIGILTTPERLDEVGGFDGLMAPMRLTMPDGSSPCPTDLDNALAAVQPTGAAPDVAPQMPDVVMPPATNSGKPGTPPVVTVDPEIAAWEEAATADTVRSMMAYLQDYPRGAHVLEARDRLAELTAPPPTADPERQAWASAEAAGTPEAMWTYLKAHPQGMHSRMAHEALRRLTAPQPAPTAPVAPPASGKRG